MRRYVNTWLSHTASGCHIVISLFNAATACAVLSDGAAVGSSVLVLAVFEGGDIYNFPPLAKQFLHWNQSWAVATPLFPRRFIEEFLESYVAASRGPTLQPAARFRRNVRARLASDVSNCFFIFRNFALRCFPTMMPSPLICCDYSRPTL